MLIVDYINDLTKGDNTLFPAGDNNIYLLTRNERMCQNTICHPKWKTLNLQSPIYPDTTTWTSRISYSILLNLESIAPD